MVERGWNLDSIDEDLQAGRLREMPADPEDLRSLAMMVDDANKAWEKRSQDLDTLHEVWREYVQEQLHEGRAEIKPAEYKQYIRLVKRLQEIFSDSLRFTDG